MAKKRDRDLVQLKVVEGGSGKDYAPTFLDDTRKALYRQYLRDFEAARGHRPTQIDKDMIANVCYVAKMIEDFRDSANAALMFDDMERYMKLSRSMQNSIRQQSQLLMQLQLLGSARGKKAAKEANAAVPASGWEDLI